MTLAPSLLFPTGTANSLSYRKAVSILSNDFPKETLDTLPSDYSGIEKLVENAINVLIEDPDWHEKKYDASCLAIVWMFNELYQMGLPLEEKRFFSLCMDLVREDDINNEETKTYWYEK